MKRFVALLLCLNILLSMLPVRVFAEEETRIPVAEETVPAQESTTPTETAETTVPVETTQATEETVAETTAPPETTEPTVIPETTGEDDQTEQIPSEETAPEETVTEETVTEETAAEETATGETVPEETEEYTVGEIQTWSCEEELPSDEEYFSAFAEGQFYGSSAAYGIAAGRTLDEGQKRIYDALAVEFRKIASGQRDSAVIAVGDYMGELTLTLSNGVQTVVPCTPAVVTDARDVDLNITTLLNVILADFPYDLYWFDKTAGVGAIPVSSNSTGKVCYVFYFNLCPKFKQNSSSGKNYYAPDFQIKTSETAAAVTAAENARKIVAEYAELSDYEKLLAYKEKICELTDYNHSAASSSYSGGYGDPWQMVWVFDGDSDTKVVCEGYSKAFQYLCDMSTFVNNIECYSVTGYLDYTASNPGDHMWNILNINGSSYLVDLTNCDSGFDLFLRGGKPSSGGTYYSFAGHTFRYRSETKNLWGTGEDSILTLATTGLTADNFPEKPDTQEPSEPTEPEEWDGAALVEAMTAAEGTFLLCKNVVIDTAVTLPEGVALEIAAPCSVTIVDGGSMTVPGNLSITDGGTLTVEAGGALVNTGTLCIGDSGMLTNNGTVANSGTITSSGILAGTGICTGTPVEEYMSLNQFRTLMDVSREITLQKPLILDASVTIPFETYVTAEAPVRVTGGAKLSVQGSLTISGAEASVLLTEEAMLVNSDTVTVEKDGKLDASEGYYISDNGKLQVSFDCDGQNNATGADVLGISLDEMQIDARTAAGDAVIRDAMEFVRGLLESSPEIIEEAINFCIHFEGNTVLSDDLELPRYCSPIIPQWGSLTVPKGMTLTDHNGMDVYGTLTAEGTVKATGWPIMFSDESCLVYPENCDKYYFNNLPLEAITVSADRTIVPANGVIRLNLGGWTPEHCRYFGDYRLELEPAGAAQWTLDENGNPQVYSISGPCEVTAVITATDSFGVDLKNSEGEVICCEIPLRFAAEAVSLYTGEGSPDFVENGYPGLYPGSSLQFYGNLIGKKGCVDQKLGWEIQAVSEELATVTLEEGVLTVTAAETLTEAATVSFTVSDPSEISAAFQYEVHLRPRAETVDVALNGETVTGKTVLYDLNRQDPDTLTLTPMTIPEAACNPAGLRADGKTPLVKWKSSNKEIATVDSTGIVTFTGKKTGTVKITMTANFGSKKDVTASVTFSVVKLPQQIHPTKPADALIGGSSATYTVYDAEKPDKALKSSAVRWFLCDETGAPVNGHPYASITTAGKLTTKTVADEDEVYLMAQVIGDAQSACLEKPVEITLYPAVGSVQILDPEGNPIQNTTQWVTDGETPVLSWSAEPYEAAVKSVSWSSSATKVATIDNNGKITVKRAGTAKFTLTVTALNGKKTTASVTMKFGIFTQELELSAILPGTKEKTTELGTLLSEGIGSGQSVSFYADNFPETVTTDGVTWSVSNKSYATISSKGVLKAKTVTNPVAVYVVAKSKDGAVTRKIPVTILPKKSAVLILNEDGDYITKTTQTLQIGESLQLNASEDVTWSSDKSSVAKVDKDGNISAQAKGTAVITAKTADKRTAKVTVKVTAPFREMTITTKKKVAFQVASGKSLDLVGTVVFEDGSKSTKVTWSVDDTSLATISSSGKLTAAKGLTSAKTVTVTATAVEGGWSQSQTVDIRPLTTGIEILDDSETDITNTIRTLDMNNGVSISLGFRTFPKGAMGVNWSTSSSKIATVDQDGKVMCLSSGTVTITATAKDGSGKKASYKLKVYKTMSEGSLKLPTTAFIGGGKTLTMTKLAGYSIDPLATNKTLIWKLTYPDGSAVPKTVATLSKGVLTTKSVKNPVELLVTATATDGSDETAQCLVTVYKVTKGVTLYSESGKSLNKKTVYVPLNGSYTILPDTTNAKGYGLADDQTADEYLPDGAAWKVTLSKQIVRVEFDGQAMTVYPDGAAVGQTVKITLKAADGSGKSAYFTVKFTQATPE